METINSNYENEMERIIREVPADYSKFTVDELYRLHLDGLFNIESVLNKLNLNMNNVLNQNNEIKTEIKKRDKFLITTNVISVSAILFVLIVEFIL